jgi:hypothetical protein
MLCSSVTLALSLVVTRYTLKNRLDRIWADQSGTIGAQMTFLLIINAANSNPEICALKDNQTVWPGIASARMVRAGNAKTRSLGSEAGHDAMNRLASENA